MCNHHNLRGYRLSLGFSYSLHCVFYFGQVFARRALGKIDELGKLEKLSGVPSSPDTKRAFKDATIKVWMNSSLKRISAKNRIRHFRTLFFFFFL